jgi:hypothetical protein
MSYEIWERALELRGQKRFGSAVGHGTPFVFPAEIVASVLDKLITAHGNDGFAAWEDLHALSLTCRDLYHLVYSAMQYLGIPWDTTIDRMRFVYGKTRGEPYRERFMRRVRECLTNPDVACRELEESAKPIVEFADALSQLPAGFHVQDPQNYVPRVKDTHVKDTRVKDPRDIGGGCNTASFALAAASNIVHFAALAFSRGRESCHIISMPFSYSTGTRSDEWISALATDGRFVVNSEIVQDALIAICQVDCVPNIYSGQTNCDDDATDDAVCFDGYLWRSGQRVVGRRSLLEHPGHNLLGCSDAFSDFRFHAGLYRELEDHHTTESYRVLPMNAIRRWMTNLVNCDLETMVRNSGDDRAKDALRAELAKRPEFAELKVCVCVWLRTVNVHHAHNVTMSPGTYRYTGRREDAAGESDCRARGELG